MGSHEAVATATQTQHPWRAVLRTFVAVGIPAFLSFAWLVPDVVQVVLDQFGAVLPESVRVVLLGIAAAITGVALVITRIMALPRAVEFARKYLRWLAPDNKPAESERIVVE